MERKYGHFCCILYLAKLKSHKSSRYILQGFLNNVTLIKKIIVNFSQLIVNIIWIRGPRGLSFRTAFSLQ